MKEMLEKYEPG